MLRSALEALRAQNSAGLPQGPHPTDIWQYTAGPHRQKTWLPGSIYGQPGVRDTACDDFPGGGIGSARVRHQSLLLYREEPEENRVARFVDNEELAQLGRALDEREADAIQLLACTGCRRGEVLNLGWRDVGASRSNCWIPRRSRRVQIGALPRNRRPDGFLFSSYTGGWTQDVFR